jgi:hypothetical protein
MNDRADEQHGRTGTRDRAFRDRFTDRMAALADVR